MNPSTIPAASSDGYHVRRDVRLDPAKRYRVKRGARKVNGARVNFDAGTLVALDPGASGRPDSDGDVYVYVVTEDGSLSTSRNGYVWAVDLYEDTTPEPYTGPTADDFAKAMEALGVDEATRGTVAKVATALAEARA